MTVRLLVCCATLLLASPAMAADAPVTVTYELAEAGNVSVAVYHRDTGGQLRTLLAGEPLEAGRHQVSWDGLDDRGRPVAPGRYEWRLLRTPGFTAEFKLNIGTNSPDARWAFWPGNHGGVFGVAADETGLYVGASGSEVAPELLKLSKDFKERLWQRGHLEAWTGGHQLVTANNRLYVLQNNARLWVLDRETGKAQLRFDVAWDRDLGDERKVRKSAGKGLSTGIGAEHAVVAYQEHDRLRWFDLGSGKMTAERELKAPAAVAVAGTDVLVASEGALWRLKTPDANPQRLAAGLVNPKALAVDPWTEQLLLVEGKPSHQIKRFSAAGQLLSTYGREGGRRAEGAYDQQTGFLDVADITALPDGAFAITEPTRAPRRTAVFNRAGEPVAEWYGGGMYFQSAEPDPRDPREVWLDSHWGTLVRARVDYEGGTWEPIGTYTYGGKAARMIGVHNNLPGYASHAWRPVYRGDTRYLVQEGQVTLMRHDEETDRLVPVAVARTNITHYWTPQPPFVKKLLNNDKRSPYRSYLWIDRNGDGEPQEDETTLHKWSGWGLDWAMDDDFSWLIADDDGRVWRLPVKGWNDVGAPVYGSLDGLQKVTEVKAPLQSGENPLGRPWRDDAGNFYCVQRGRKDKHGDMWPSHGFGDSRLLKFTPDGQVRWAVGRKAMRTPAPPNYLHTPLRVIGSVHDCVVLAERTVSPATVYTRDGLYAGRFLDNRADDELPAQVYRWWRDPETRINSPINYDMLRGGSIAQLPDGAVYWMAAGWNSNPTYRITGWDGWTRQTGTVQVAGTPPHAEAAGTGLTAHYYSHVKVKQMPAVKPDQADEAAEASELEADAEQKARRPLTGEPTVTRIDPQVWFKWGGRHRAPELPKEVAPHDFSVVWEGVLEMPFSEPFVFSTYTRGGVRLWIDGRLVIDDWTDYAGEQPYQYTGKEFYKKNASKPIPLVAGQRVPIRMEYYQSTPLEGAADRNIPQAHLMWESTTLSREHIPQAYLYPKEKAR